jgi:hypothetical protein
MVWDFGLFNGQPIIWENFAKMAQLEKIIWLGLPLLAIALNKFVYKNGKKISLFFIILQSIYIGVLYFQQPEVPSFKKYYVDETNQFNFSTNKNIIYLLLDSLQGDVVFKMLSEDQSNFEMMDGFIFYPDTVGPYGQTDLAVPSLLTETKFMNKQPTIPDWTKVSFEQCSLFEILGNNSFINEIYTHYPTVIHAKAGQIANYHPKRFFYYNEQNLSEMLKLADISLFRSFPTLIKKYIYNDQSWQLQDSDIIERLQLESVDLNKKTISFIKDLELEITANADQNIFKFIHLFGAHPPYKINRNLEYGTPDKNVDGHQEQVRGLLALIKILNNSLKEEGVYDNTMIVILGDHGIGHPGSETINRIDTYSEEYIAKHYMKRFTRKQANPAILIKPFNSNGELKVDSKRAYLNDLSTTVLATLNLDSCSDSGINLLNEEVDTDDRVRVHGPFTVNGHVNDMNSWLTFTQKGGDYRNQEATNIPKYPFGLRLDDRNVSLIDHNLVTYPIKLDSPPKTDILLRFKMEFAIQPSFHIYFNKKIISTVDTGNRVIVEDEVKIPKELFHKGTNFLSFFNPENTNSSLKPPYIKFFFLEEIK